VVRFFAILSLAFATALAGCGPKKGSEPGAGKPGPGKSVVVEIHNKQWEIATPDPRTTLQGTIHVVINLLEAGYYRTFFEAYVSPDDRKAVAESGKTIDDVIKEFAAKRASTLLKALKDVEGKEPELSKDGAKATFLLEGDLAKEAPSSTIVLIKVDGIWFIKN